MLRFYSSLDLEDEILTTEDSAGIGAFTVTFDGRLGGAQVHKFFIKNDDPTRTYTDITVAPVDLSGSGYVDQGGELWSWKLIAQDTPPSEGSWNSVVAGASVVLGSLSDASSMASVWVRVHAPRHTPAQLVGSVVLRVTAKEVLNA